jgi:hypothetical protein
MSPDDPALMESPYFCHACRAEGRDPNNKLVQFGGVFNTMFKKLDSHNVASFQLPKKIRGYFEDVSTRENGEYHDISEPRVALGGKTRSTTTLDDQLNEGPKLMTCYSCKESSAAGRMIVQCDECDAQWHLDCLDPPLANPPSVAPNGKSRAYFRCPLHVSIDIRLMNNALLTAGEDFDRHVKLAQNADDLRRPVERTRVHKLRYPKHPHVVKPAIERGNKNNGNIEVYGLDDLTQEDDVMYELSAKAVAMDFITRAKRQRLEGQNQRWEEALEQWQNDHVNLDKRLRTIITPEIQTLVQQEVLHVRDELQPDSREAVEQEVARRLEEFKVDFYKTQGDFTRRPYEEQAMALFLTGFAKEHEVRGIDAQNIATLSRAVTVSLTLVG